MGQVRWAGWTMAIATALVISGGQGARADVASDRPAAIVVYPKIVVDSASGHRYGHSAHEYKHRQLQSTCIASTSMRIPTARVMGRSARTRRHVRCGACAARLGRDGLQHRLDGGATDRVGGGGRIGESAISRSRTACARGTSSSTAGLDRSAMRRALSSAAGTCTHEQRWNAYSAGCGRSVQGRVEVHRRR